MEIIKRKYAIILLIAIVTVIGLSTVYASTENDTSNKTTLSFKSTPPISVSEMVNAIRFSLSSKTYDYDTLSWLKEFNTDYVVYYIVMNSTDANKISANATTSISVSNTISYNILENNSLGHGLNNILHVEDVELISSDLKNFDFSG